LTVRRPIGRSRLAALLACSLVATIVPISATAEYGIPAGSGAVITAGQPLLVRVTPGWDAEISYEIADGSSVTVWDVAQTAPDGSLWYPVDGGFVPVDGVTSVATLEGGATLYQEAAPAEGWVDPNTGQWVEAAPAEQEWSDPTTMQGWIDPATGAWVEPAAQQGWVDPNTGAWVEPAATEGWVDPNTGEWVEPATSEGWVDPNTGEWVQSAPVEEQWVEEVPAKTEQWVEPAPAEGWTDPNTGEWVEPAASEGWVDPNTGQWVEPATQQGWIDPNTGAWVDPATQTAASDGWIDPATGQWVSAATTQGWVDPNTGQWVEQAPATEVVATDGYVDPATGQWVVTVPQQAVAEPAPADGWAAPAPADTGWTGGTEPWGEPIATAYIYGTDGDGAACRAAPDRGTSKIAVLWEGEPVEVRGEAVGEWQPVNCGGVGGYVNTSLISWEPTQMVVELEQKRRNRNHNNNNNGNNNGNANNNGNQGGGAGNDGTASASGQQIANFAMQYVGYPYAYAGEGPYAFDCSGFAKFVIQNTLGMDITHDMFTQIGMGQQVGINELQPGDLVFFSNTFRPGLSHVGIYTGGGQFVHAENESTGVVVSDINSDYYGSRWAGATRLG
jgi:cell wall-associated NlpC family hydrolase